jgi:hypothetical protein
MPRRHLALVVSLIAFLGALTALSPAGSAGAKSGPAEPRRAARAVAALKVVDELAAGRGGRADLTMALRDLAVLRDALPAAEQKRAASYLARPTDKPTRCIDVSCYRTRKVRRACSGVVCVHWVRRADDRRNGVSRKDRDRDGKPNYVEKVLATVTKVHRTFVRAGYRAPLPDGRRGGNGKRDIYLAQIGNFGFYGYCTTDDRRVPRHGAASAYCVLDNDYRKREFPVHTPIQNMQVTAAHEYFHAVQFGYDVGEDNWFMEGTATWVEDEVFDRVNDNRFYLPDGPLGHPQIPLNTFQVSGLYQYGTWIFFRDASEWHQASTGGLPRIVRRMWQFADARGASAPNLASLGAIQEALEEQGDGLAQRFTLMATHNRTPGADYSEGAAYPTAPLEGAPLSPTAGMSTPPLTENYEHLTSRTYRVEVQPGVAELQVDLSLSDAGRAVIRQFHGALPDQADSVISTSGLQTIDVSTGVTAIEITIANGHRSASRSLSVTVEATP